MSTTPKKVPVRKSAFVRVRMYNVGFGDAFLVLVPTKQGERRILFDCGSVGKGPHSMDDIVARIIRDVTGPDGKARIDVVVATHRHRDHVSGFGDEAWREVEVGEVWLPWTEDPKDPQARRILETQCSLAAALDAAVTRELASPRLGAAERGRWERAQLLTLNALTNEKAMDTLHSGFAGEPVRRFLPVKDGDTGRLATGVLPGVSVIVMGPSRDPEVIRDMDPPKNREWLALLNGGAAAGSPDPFRAEWWIPPGRYPAKHLEFSADDRKALAQMSAELDPGVATSLDQAVNGTSLMLMLQVGKANLLFPGDAQWGTWQAALKNPQWRDLMKRTSFYKIGHHGSHNATPKEFVEEVVGKDFWAMASTKPVPNWPNIPKAELLTGLGRKTKKIARSDREQDVPKSAFTVEAGGVIEARIPV